MAAITRMGIQRWLLVALLLLAGGVVAWDVVRTTEEVEEAADRYERVNARIEEAMPKGEGIAPTAQSWSVPGDLTITITTRAARDGEAVQVEIRVEEDGPWTLPLPPPEVTDDARDAWWRDHADPALQEVERAVTEFVHAHDPQTGRILTSLGVPHELAIRALSILVEAGVTDVAFGRATK